MNSHETVSIIGVRSDGAEVHLGAAPIPPTMKAREILRSYFGNELDHEGSDADIAMAAMEEFILWLQKTGRLVILTTPNEPNEPLNTLVAVKHATLTNALKALEAYIQGGPKRLILEAETQIKTALANSKPLGK